jgi:hypothetical protein
LKPYISKILNFFEFGAKAANRLPHTRTGRRSVASLPETPPSPARFDRPT